MRRTDRECTDSKFMNDVLETAREISLAFKTDDFPYTIPLNFVLYNSHLYIHCASEGRKLDLIAADSRVAFSAYVDARVYRHTTYYRCVCGTGHACVVDDAEEKQNALHALSLKYGSACQYPTPQEMLDRIAVVRIEIASCTGKAHLPKN